MKYVIIGNSAAAIGAVEGIRQIDQKGKIVLIASEPYHTYSRPLISYYLAGKTNAQRMKYRPDDFYADNGCEVMLGRQVTKIQNAQKQVLLDDGTKVSYDKLLVATGSSAFVPPFEGLDTVQEKLCFMTLDDALLLEQKICSNTRVLIIGAGLIGLKCAEGIAGRVSDITVIDLSENVLSSILDETASKMVQKHLESQGLRFLLGRTVSRFDKNTAMLSDGGKVDYDLLVLAVGVKPNTALISEIGGDVGRGIRTDAMMQTSISDIYAAGDCTESMDISCGQSKVLALLPNAYRQGECAGINMAGGSKDFGCALPLNAIGFFGMHILTAGSYTGDTYIEEADDMFKKLFFKDNTLKGFILINKTQNAGIYTSLIREQTPLDSIDFDLICKEPSLMAFTREHRQQILGGTV